MGFIADLMKVVIGAFALFTAANISFKKLVPSHGWSWVVFVGCLSLANMLIHRWLFGHISPPVYTAVFFGMTLMGLYEADDGASKMWCKRGVYAVVAGTLIGWVFYGEIRAA